MRVGQGKMLIVVKLMSTSSKLCKNSNNTNSYIQVFVYSTKKLNGVHILPNKFNVRQWQAIYCLRALFSSFKGTSFAVYIIFISQLFKLLHSNDAYFWSNAKEKEIMSIFNSNDMISMLNIWLEGWRKICRQQPYLKM